MALWVNDVEKQNYLRDYFSSMNCIALRLIESREKIKQKYSDAWYEMTPKEQEKCIDDHIIPQHIKEKYASIETPITDKEPSNIISTFPALKMKTGQRDVSTVCNNDGDSDNEKSDTEVTWKDEHSEPFCWETMSQMNMTLPLPNTREIKQVDKKPASPPTDVSDIKFNVPSELTKFKLVTKLSSENNSNSISLNSKNDNSHNSVSKNETTLDKTKDIEAKQDTLADILNNLNPDTYGGHLITITSSALDVDEKDALLSNEEKGGNIEVKQTKYNPEPDREKDLKKNCKKGSESSLKTSQFDDDQLLLANAEPFPADKPRLSGFDFLDNW